MRDEETPKSERRAKVEDIPKPVMFFLKATHTIFNAVLYALCVVAAAYVFTLMWGWFVVPMFNLPRMTIPVAGGLMLTAMFPSRFGVFASNMRNTLDKTSPTTSWTTDNTAILAGYLFLVVPSTLLIAYLWSLLLP